jgi:hypothetical protein
MVGEEGERGREGRNRGGGGVGVTWSRDLSELGRGRGDLWKGDLYWPRSRESASVAGAQQWESAGVTETWSGRAWS